MGYTLDYRSILREEFAARRIRNQRYSARAFSRDLGVSPGFLSQVLHGRKALNEERALKIADRLMWGKDKRKAFTILVRSEAARDPKAKARIQEELNPDIHKPIDFRDLDADAFRVISDWYHFAIVELAKTDVFRLDAAWVAKRLSITADQATKSIERLERLGLVERSDSILKPAAHYKMRDVPSTAIRSFHCQMLKKADSALRQQSFDQRDFSGITMAIDPTRIPEAKERLRQFRRELMTYLEGGKKTAVYHLGMQLFRLDEES